MRQQATARVHRRPALRFCGAAVAPTLRCVIALWQFPLLFAAAFAAGFVDSIAGGGGLITVPVLLSLGMDPRHALGTNKLQAVFGSGGATWHYARAGIVPLGDCKRGFVLTFLGAAVGTLMVQRLDPALLKRVIPMLLLGVALFVLLKPKLGDTDLHPRMGRGAFDATFGLLIGFYDGFFGPGTGSFWTVAFLLGLDLDVVPAGGDIAAPHCPGRVENEGEGAGGVVGGGIGRYR